MKKMMVIIFVLISTQLLPNGGPVDGYNFYRFGTIAPLTVKNIFLEKEWLLIRLDGDYSIVTVFYSLKNNGSEQKVTYGFPVDYEYSGEEAKDNSDLFTPGIEQPQYAIYDGSSKLPVSIKADPIEISETIKDSLLDVVTLQLHRFWFITDLNFSPGEEKELMVSFRVKNNFIDWATSKSCFVDYSHRQMIYDFSPAKGWGNGTIREFEVTIDAYEILQNYGSCSIEGLPGMIERNGFFTCHKSNVLLDSLKSMRIVYDNSIEKKSQEIITNCLQSNEGSAFKVSSELAGTFDKMVNSPIRYDARNLKDWDFKTAWAEGKKGPGIGEYIEINEKKDSRISCIAIMNGYMKNENTYYNNNRIKTIQMDCYTEAGEIDTDWSRLITLKDVPYKEITNANFAKMLSVIYDFGDGNIGFKKIRLTIKDVYPGKKFDDTCVSELIVW